MSEINSFNNTNRLGSIVNNGRLYESYPCKNVGRPDYYGIVTAESVIALNCGILSVSGCSYLGKPLEIPFMDIKGCATSTTCEAATSQVVTLDCYEADCASNVITSLSVVMDYENCNPLHRVWNFYKAWDCGCEGEKTCAEKMAKFVEYINSAYGDELPFVASVPLNGTTITLTSKSPTSLWRVDGYEGLGNYTVVSHATSGGYKASDLELWDIADCLPDACSPDKCFETLKLDFMEWTPNDRDQFGGSNPSRNNYSYYGALKTVVFLVDPTVVAAVAKMTEIETILSGAATPVTKYFNKLTV